MKKYFLCLFIIFLLTTNAQTKNKSAILKNLINIDNLSFNFEQNINGKIENGFCIIEYPKKIFCKYDLKNEKILVSNGKYLVIKTAKSRHVYPLNKTPLNFILDKNFLLEKLKSLKSRDIDNNLINFKFSENNNEINLFFSKTNLNLIGWQTTDMYQNLSITYLSSISKNNKLKKNLFLLPQ